MPYTPPAQRSPVASESTTPLRKPEKLVQPATKPQQNGNLNQDGVRPRLPRSHSSQSYLHKHRRSPSLSKQTAELAELAALENTLISQHSNGNLSDTSDALNRLNGIAVKRSQEGTDSPPSSQSSSDEGPSTRGRHRKMANLEELQAAIRGIEQNRQGSPVPPEERQQHELARDFSKPHLEGAAVIKAADDYADIRPPLTESARKISHSRSNTDTNTYFDMAKPEKETPPRAGSDEDLDEEDLAVKPSLIRKKSGELVRPALRGRRRPSSMPGTPTYSKAVHFQDNSLEHVRTFLQVDRPIAVSAGSSPVDLKDDEEEFPFNYPDSRQAPYEWEMKLTNFPRDTYHRQALPARTEKVYLSADTKTLYGDIAVRNLAFHKLVIARFTLDYWKTTSEVVAEFNRDVRRASLGDSCDRFTFEIKLEEHANLENKTLFFCVRYQVAGKEFWDNNDSMNYQVDFAKKLKSSSDGRPTPQTTNARAGLPRSRSPQMRPRSMPSFDDFGNHSAPFNFTSFPPSTSVTGDTPIRFRQKPSTVGPVSDTLQTKPKNPANQNAFSNRYDFGASLSAAIQNSANKVPSPRQEVPAIKTPQPPKTGLKEPIDGGKTTSKVSEPAALASDKPALQSTSYTELLDKYCFFGSGKTSSPQPREPSDLKSPPTQTSGTDGASTPPETIISSVEATVSASPSPPHSPSPVLQPKNFVLSTKSSSSRTSRSGSPGRGSAMTSRSHSPGFGYPFHQNGAGNFFETHTPTAIHG